jgi:hypothetical protein
MAAPIVGENSIGIRRAWRSFQAPIRRSASSSTWASIARWAAASASARAFRSASRRNYAGPEAVLISSLSCDIPLMASTPTARMVRAQFLGLILMSVALGMLVTNAFDNWLRGYTVIWWLALILVNIFAIGAASITVAKRIN